MGKWIFALFILCQVVLCYSESCLHSGQSHPKLAGAVACELGAELGLESVQNQNVYFIQSLKASENYSLNDLLMELFSKTRKMKRQLCRNVTAILPYFSNELNKKDAAHLLESGGINRVICFDSCCKKYFKKAAVYTLSSSSLLASYLAHKEWEDPVIISLKESGLAYAKGFVEQLKECGVQATLGREGTLDFKGRDLILVDEFCESATLLMTAAELFEKRGAGKIFACVAHSQFSPLELEEIKGSLFDTVVVTDTLPQKGSFPENVAQISVAQMVAESIFKIETNREF